MAKFGIAHLSIVPVRAEASDASEMVSQLLFGETFQIIKTKGNWTRISQSLDNYEGWIDLKQYIDIDEKAYRTLSPLPHTCASDLVQLVKSEEGNMTPIVAGSTLPNYKKSRISFADKKLEFDGEICHPKGGDLKKMLRENALTYRNAPYLWGGRSPFGVDCSGFTQVIFKMAGIAISRDSSEQAKLGHTLSFVEEADIGDLAFFDNDEGTIIHVGMIIAPATIIHASGKVRIDSLDHQGIFNVDTKRYTHKLRLLRRLNELEST